jgi:hypothetical protein
LKKAGSPLLIAVYEHLCVASTAEDVASLFKLAAELRVIENLTRRGKDYLTIFVSERLSGPTRVNDVESDVSESDLPAGIESAAVCSPVPDRRSHAPQRIEGNSSRRESGNSRYAAHRKRQVRVI